MTIARELANLLNSNGKVEGTKIADDAVDSAHYAPTSVDGEHIANDTITATQIAGDTITAAEIAANAVGSSELGASSVTSTELANDAVTGAKLNPALVQGDIIYADGTDTINRLAKGTAAQVLTMNAGATAPGWVTPAFDITNPARGKILQVVQTVVTAATASKTGGGMTDVPGLSRDILISSTSSKILITGHIVIGGTNHCTPQCQIVRGSTIIGMGDTNFSNNLVNSAGSSATQGVHQTIPFEFLDAPGLDVNTTYKIRWAGGGTFKLNRVYNDGNNSNAFGRTVSVITLYEIGA